MTLLDIVLKEMRRRKCAFAEDYIPFYICSACAHYFNLWNKSAKVLYHAGRLADTRLHIVHVAPPGMCKTFFLEQMLQPETGVLTRAVSYGFEQKMTEAGFVGSIIYGNGAPQVVYGAAYEYRDKILAVEEFAALSRVMQETSYGAGLEEALLTALDSGRVKKRLRGGVISYETNVTLWTATQPAKYDLSSGLGRRLLFLTFIPTEEDLKRLKIARRRGHNIKPDPEVLDEVDYVFASIRHAMHEIRRVEFHDDLYEALDRLDVPHYEEMLYERLALGYWLATQPVSRRLTVSIDDELRRLFSLAARYRHVLRTSPELYQVLKLLESGPKTMKQLSDVMLIFGYSYEQVAELVFKLARLRMIRVEDGLVSLRSQPQSH